VPVRLPLAERRTRERVAANLRRLREAADLTLEEAGDRANIHWRHWQKIEAGEVNLTLRSLTRLAGGLGVDVDQLFVHQ
jgi:transcriptional regulator with XRE-family HTH domain